MHIVICLIDQKIPESFGGLPVWRSIAEIQSETRAAGDAELLEPAPCLLIHREVLTEQILIPVTSRLSH